MARNQEKAQSMLNRYLQAKRDAAKGPVERRPRLASEVASVAECEKWRGQIIRAIAKKVAIIQNGPSHRTLPSAPPSRSRWMVCRPVTRLLLSSGAYALVREWVVVADGIGVCKSGDRLILIDAYGRL
jgi:hypothetical protein